MHTLTRRNFLFLAGSAALAPRLAAASRLGPWNHPYAELSHVERARVLSAAQEYLHQQPRTITSVPAPRSAGGLHDYYSEGDYWWPNPANPSGPYIRRDGESNPANFIAHRELLIRLSIQMPALTAAWLLTQRRDYADHAIAHLRAWFVNPATRMNPNLEYAQAIQGINTGRSIGIIDTVHLVEVAQAAIVLNRFGMLTGPAQEGTRAWFTSYLKWLTTSQRGHQERDKRNNHGSCWLLQASGFATYTGNYQVREQCRTRLTTILFPNQIAADGSFPLELARTKPYSYSLFNLDILGMSAHILTTPADNLWTFTLPGGRGLQACFRFMAPYIRNKKSWPFRHDVQYFNDLPVRQPSLLFAGFAYQQPGYLALWQSLNPDPTVPEIIRNHPIRQPLVWIKP
ncbi:MAG TPA: alginate lyase family protein [Acidobacteriaceae bacterium]|nr:alginate lyase family protein [Acidobacteriaceae bacterium]